MRLCDEALRALSAFHSLSDVLVWIKGASRSVFLVHGLSLSLWDPRTIHTLEKMEASDSGTLHAFCLSKVLYNREAGEVGPTRASSHQRCWAV